MQNVLSAMCFGTMRLFSSGMIQVSDFVPITTQDIMANDATEQAFQRILYVLLLFCNDLCAVIGNIIKYHVRMNFELDFCTLNQRKRAEAVAGKWITTCT